VAAKLQLRSPVLGMSFIWNVSHHVGDNISCENLATDVELVKILMAETMRPHPPQWVNPLLRIPFVINGQMDIAVAYWIRVFNDRQESALSYLEAGIISPARGVSFGKDCWTIFKLNNLLKQLAPNIWQDLPNYHAASSQLRSELLGLVSS
jgi:hypothetical protein